MLPITREHIHLVYPKSVFSQRAQFVFLRLFLSVCLTLIVNIMSLCVCVCSGVKWIGVVTDLLWLRVYGNTELQIEQDGVCDCRAEIWRGSVHRLQRSMAVAEWAMHVTVYALFAGSLISICWRRVKYFRFCCFTVMTTNRSVMCFLPRCGVRGLISLLHACFKRGAKTMRRLATVCIKTGGSDKSIQPSSLQRFW